MVAGLHRPDLVPLRGEGLSSITLHANVRKYRLSILVERQASRVVVIVVVVIVTRLDGEGEQRASCDKETDARIIDVSRRQRG